MPPRLAPHRTESPLTRRELLARGGAGFGALALGDLLASSEARATEPAPSAPKLGPYRLPTRVRSVIFLFMEGGPSQIDTFDPKPLLQKLAGQKIPPSFKPVITPMGEFYSPILPTKRKWQQHGKGGLWISDWLPHTAKQADELCVIRSCWANGLNHVGGVCQMNTGSILAGRPCLGSWVSYGLGTENQNLPAFVVMRDRPGTVAGGPRNWGAGFMPATYQGTEFQSAGDTIPNLSVPKGVSEERRRSELDFLAGLNADYGAPRGDQTELEARIRSYELAFRMQSEAPEAVDLSLESEETRSLYGLDDPVTATYGKLCLLSRRLVERGVRFVQLYHGAGSKWDAHTDIEGNHARQCREMDKPVAGLLADLKRRGLLDETLVIWGGEFGRTPQSEKGDGRDHNPYGFTMWLAGGGVPGGTTIGTTDEVGLHAIEERLHVHDLHATILALMGVDHTKLVYIHKGRPERATLNEGRVLESILPSNA